MVCDHGKPGSKTPFRKTTDVAGVLRNAQGVCNKSIASKGVVRDI